MAFVPSCPCPPPDKRPFVKLLKVPPFLKVAYVCLSDFMVGYMIHYENRRTHPCTAAVGRCRFDHASQPPRWAGYIAVRPQTHPVPYLLPLTPGSVQNCPTLMKMDGNLRGKLITPYRLGQAPTSPLRVEVSNPPDNPVWRNALPVIDLPSALSRLWGCELLEVVQSDADGEIPLS